MTNIRAAAIIFDLDGTLIDSMHIWDQIDDEFLARRGFRVPPDYQDKINGMGFRQVAEYTIARFGLTESADELLAEWQQMAIDHYRNDLSAKAGAEAYLQSLQSSGIPLAIATSLPASLYQPVLAKNHLQNYFRVLLSTDQVGCSKEQPKIFLQAAQLLGVSPKHCWVFEDVLPAIRSAKRAGMSVCAVYDPANQADWEHICASADLAITDFHHAPTAALFHDALEQKNNKKQP